MMGENASKAGATTFRLTRRLVGACIALLWTGLAVVIVALAILAHGREAMLTYLGRGDVGLTGTGFYLLVAVGFVCLAASLVLGILFLRELLAFLRSCAEGDPFDPANADRFGTMAWLMFAMEALGGLAQVYGRWLLRYSREGDCGIGFSMSGMIAVLSLFVLARVFRAGAAMRDELRETV